MSIARLLDVRNGDGIIGAPNLNQEHYIQWVRFIRHCETNGLCTVVASHYGTSGTGEDFHDGANPADDNAFIYAEWDAGVKRFGVLVQWADEESWGASGGPATMDASTVTDGVGVQMAFREDGSSPWAGTTNDDGSDTKGTVPNTGPVWTPGSSIVHVFPRSNNPGPPVGSHNTDKQNHTRVGLDDVTGFARMHFVANEDGIFQLFSNLDDGNYTGIYVGRYIVRSGLTLTNPYIMVTAEASVFWALSSSNPYGGTAGNNTQNGGIVANTADGVRDAALSINNAGAHESVYQPNNLVSPAEFELAPITVFQRETTPGLAGFLPTELVSCVQGASSHNTNAAADLAYIGDSDASDRKWAISWDGGAVPGTNNTRTGRLSFDP